VGVCGSDIHYFEHGRIGRFTVDAPLILGHEASGEVVGLGSAVSRLTLGQRVSLEPGVPDFTCSQCIAGRYNLCTGMRFFATPPIDGAFAELVTIHEQFAHAVPDQLSDDAAALLEPLSVGLWACRKAEVTAGTRVLVTGAGPVGLVTAQCALALGASEVTVTDVNRHRLQLARDLGVTTTWTPPPPRWPIPEWSPTPCWSARDARRQSRTRCQWWRGLVGWCWSVWARTTSLC